MSASSLFNGLYSDISNLPMLRVRHKILHTRHSSPLFIHNSSLQGSSLIASPIDPIHPIDPELLTLPPIPSFPRSSLYNILRRTLLSVSVCQFYLFIKDI